MHIYICYEAMSNQLMDTENQYQINIWCVCVYIYISNLIYKYTSRNRTSIIFLILLISFLFFKLFGVCMISAT